MIGIGKLAGLPTDLLIDGGGDSPARDTRLGVPIDPDDPLADEGVVNVGAPGTVSGVIDFDGDSDDITVTLTAGQTYLISLRGTGADPVQDAFLQLLDPLNAIVAHDDNGGNGADSLLTFTAASSGVYTIRASTAANPGGPDLGGYTVDVRVQGADAVGDTNETAVAIDPGVIFGFRETATVSDPDLDRYAVTLEAGWSYSFRLAGGADAETAFQSVPLGEIDTILRLRDASGTLLASNDDLDFPDDISSGFTFTPGTSGVYYLDVTGYSGQVGGYVLEYRIDAINGTSGPDSLTGTPGEDVINGLAGDDVIDGLESDDVITGGAGADHMTGGAGSDRFVLTDASESPNSAFDRLLDFTTGEDQIDVTGAGTGRLFLQRFDGSTFLYFDTNGDGSYFEEGVIRAYGDVAGTDILGMSEGVYYYGDAAGSDETLDGSALDDVLAGQGGQDILNGGAGIDWLYGGDGDDFLSGGADGDVLIGGAGADRFYVGAADDSTTSAWDTILEFEIGTDLLDLSQVASSVFLSEFNGSTFVYFDPGGDGTYEGVVIVVDRLLTQDDVLVAGDAAGGVSAKDEAQILPGLSFEDPLVLPADLFGGKAQPVDWLV